MGSIAVQQELFILERKVVEKVVEQIRRVGKRIMGENRANYAGRNVYSG